MKAHTKSASDDRDCKQALLRAVPRSARRILEVSCGAGCLGAALKDQDPERHLWGIEYEPAVAARAARRLDHVFVLNLEDSDPPIEPGSLDCILYRDVLEHLRAPAAVLCRQRRWLRPGGIILCAVPNLQHHSLLRALLTGDFPDTDAGLLAASQLPFFTYSTFFKLLVDAGFAPTLIDTCLTPCPEEFRAAAEPLLRHLGLDPSRMQRCLEASQYLFQGTLLCCSEESGRVLAQKWEDQVPSVTACARIDTPEKHEAEGPSASRPRVSLCLIVKNEEANLPACLESVADLVEEIIVVDTGSSDATKDIAARFGAQVVDFPWVDSFAAARNESLRHATGDWIFWLDADDRLDATNRQRLRAVLDQLGDDNVAYVMKCLCLPEPSRQAGTVVDHVRLFRKHPQIRWQYRVHEQILPAVRQRGGQVRWTEVVIHHTGYQDPALRQRKLQRDLRLLRLDHAEHPDDPFILFNLGQIYHEQGQPAEALAFLHGSLERSHPSDSIVRKLYALLAQCYQQLGQPAEALAVCRSGRDHYAEDGELLFLEALLLRQLGDRARAKTCLERLVHLPPGQHFASVDAGLHSYKARHNLAILCQEEGQFREAEDHWQQVLADQPDFLPAWMGLAELYLAQARWSELDAVAEQLETRPGRVVEAVVVRARGHLAQRDFATARQLLEEINADAPHAVWPRVLLSHVLLQEGRDWPAAEQALREILARDPNHAEARHNLAILLQQHGRAAS